MALIWLFLNAKKASKLSQDIGNRSKKYLIKALSLFIKIMTTVYKQTMGSLLSQG
jgi:hypothetical protein